MEEQDFVSVAVAVLKDNTEARQLLCQGLEAHTQLTEALEALREPEVFLEGHFELARWEHTLRQSVGRFGVVFFAACQRLLNEQGQREGDGEVLVGQESAAECGLMCGVHAGAEGEPPGDLPVGVSSAEPVGLLPVLEFSVDSTAEEDVRVELSSRTKARIEALEKEEAEEWRQWAQRQSEASNAQDPVVVQEEGSEDDGERLEESEACDGLASEGGDGALAHDAVLVPEPEDDGVEVTADLLERLQASLSTKTWEPQGQGEAVDVGEVHGEILVRGRGLMEGFEHNLDANLMLDCLNEASSEAFLALCGHTSNRLQGVYVEFVAALARHFQEHFPSKASEANHVFARLLRFIDVDTHGFLHGLGRDQVARQGSWWKDAQWLWRRLDGLIGVGGDVLNPGLAQRRVEALLDECETPQCRTEGLVELLELGMQPDTRVLRLLASVVDELGGGKLRNLRRKVREQIEADEAVEKQPQDGEPVLPDDWPYWHITEGRPVVLIGSAGKKFQRENICRAFKFSSLDWVDSCRSLRRVQALAQSIREGDDRVFIIMHRYVSHSASDKIWAHRHHATVIGVDHGFGVHAVRQAIERHCR